MREVVRKGFQEEATSGLNPEGHVGTSQVKRKGRADQAEGTAGPKAEALQGGECVTKGRASDGGVAAMSPAGAGLFCTLHVPMKPP